ncbi:MAG: radical SAM protein [Thermoprotei archaeon]|nr:MAG: radical SAM protein [Thermoprotei archaeon]
MVLVRKQRVRVDPEKCRSCLVCVTVSACRSPERCIGCLACFWACPYEARVVEEVEEEVGEVTIYVDGVAHRVPDGVTVARALESIGYSFREPGHEPSLACRTGGCWSCALVIDGELERTCITPVRDGMRISTDLAGATPRRIVHGPEPHTVGGKATPWWEVDYRRYVEAAIWTAGCDLRCPQCQNYAVTYDNVSPALTPREAARAVAACHRLFNTRGVAVSGGEPTLNRRWILEFFREVTRLVGRGVRRHLDSNGTLLTPDYIDELVEAGCNNIGVEPKCVRPDTYARITGLDDLELARKYLERAWRAVEYIYDNYREEVYLGVGLVYNPKLVSLEELIEAGRRIASIGEEIQVTVLDYFPAFRRRDIKRPSVRDMLRVKRALEEVGLKTVVVQTRIGHFGPGNRRAGLLH